jgi:HK97 family phage major capsid protein
MSTENQVVNPAELIAKEVKSAVDHVNAVSKQMEGAVNEIKSFQDFQKTATDIQAEMKSFKSELEAKSNEEIKSLKMEIEAMQEKQKKSVAVGGQESGSILDKPEIQELVKKSFTNTSFADRTLIEDKDIKSLVSYNNAQAGALMKPISVEARTITTNAQVQSPLPNLVTRITRSSTIGTAYPVFDENFTDINASLEGMSKAEKKEYLSRGVVEINTEFYTEYKTVSNVLIHAVRAGDFQQDVIRLEYEALLRKFDRQVAREILSGVTTGKGIKGILQRPFQANSRINVVPTAAVNKPAWQDVANLPSTLKSQYYNGAAFVFDKQAFDELYNDEAQDGHLKSERFSYSQASGMISLNTAFGTFPVIMIDSFPSTYTGDHAGFANYPVYPNGGSQVTSGYIKGGTNTGKAYAVFANLANCYTLYESSTFEAGIDDSFKDRIVDGFNMMGLAKYVGGAVVLQEAIAIGYIS